MTDRWVLALALAAGVGALRPSAFPLAVGLAVVAVGRVSRRPIWLCLGVALLVSSLGGRSLAGLDGVEAGPVRAEVTLLTDPTPAFGQLRAEVRLGGRRVDLVASGPAADALQHRLAGERVSMRGTLQPADQSSPWVVSRHVAGRVRVHVVESWRPGPLPTQLANGLRRTLVRGAAPLSAHHRSLFTGLVIGDDRTQPPELADDFLGAGLTHLLAVSGQNVAFVLTLAAPVLRRLRLWPRLGATLAVVALFGLVTRFEPSVLRASAMAGLSVTLVTIGSPGSRLRIVGLALTGLLVVDPLLIRSVGFLLSSAATVAIVALAPRLATVLPGPPGWRDAAAVTIAAQIGVAPVLLAVFGPVPVASLPANLVAVPLAAPIMMWGLTGGMVAGLAGPGLAELLHLPTRVLLAALAAVAERGAALPLGELAGPHVAVLAAGLLLAAWRPPLRRAGSALAAGAVLVAVVAAQAPDPLRSQLGPGLVRWHANGTEVVVLGGDSRSQLGAEATLAALRTAGVGAVDLLVLADASVPAGVVRAVRARHPVATVMSPRQLGPVGSNSVIEVGALTVRATVVAGRVVVEAAVGSGRER